MILTVTLNPAVDHTVRIDELPASGSVARTDDAQFDPGGKGINVSKYLVGLGADTLATGLVGDFLGDYIANSLDEEGIPRDFVDIDGSSRLNTTLLTDDAEYKINHDGPRVSRESVDDVVDTIERYDPSMVVIAGSRPPGLGPDAVDRIARAGPWRTAVDVGGETLAELSAAYAVCKPNREELAAATGRAVDSLEDCVAAARALREQGFDRVVASLGADGALVAGGEGVLHAAALNVDVVDTVGAGDALLSGFVDALERGRSDREALQAGVAVSSRVVAVTGTDVPRFADVQSDVESVSVSVV
ncbi:1-phosphofructokinase [Halostella litorea]|uniref:1-phosphofructokinase n=1 Tax=Halostella litorea TaxID=2528831 RepID=UPI001092340F|nr:1-phosphofructokinase [Halostella litorea]